MQRAEQPLAGELVAHEQERHADAEDGVDDHGDDRHADGEPQGVDDVGVLEDRRAGRSRPSAKVFLTTSDTGQATRRNR